MWAFFGVARYFECADAEGVRVRIFEWIYHGTNELFIHVAPELCLAIGSATKLAELYRDAFAILVGEEALQLMTPWQAGDKRATHTVHGRYREVVDDIEKTRIEYASKTLAEGLTCLFQDLSSGEMSWLEDIEEYRSLALITISNLSILSPGRDAKEFLQSRITWRGLLVQNLKDYVRSILNSNIRMERTWSALYEHDDGEAIHPFLHTYNNLSPQQRLFTKTFWYHLNREDFHLGAYEYSIRGTPSQDPSKWDPLGPQPEVSTEGYYLRTSPSSLREVVGKFNRILQETQSISVPENHVNTLSREEDNKLEFPFEQWTSQNPWTQPPEPRIDVFVSSQKFNLDQFLMKVSTRIGSLCRSMRSSDEGSNFAPYNAPSLLDTLICLRDEEFKYLPLWAGGNDDGTGGVFGELVPNDEFVGEQFILGEQWDGGDGKDETVESHTVDLFSTIGHSEASTLQGLSRRATDGYATSGVISLGSSVDADD